MSVSLSGIAAGSGYLDPSSISPTQRQSGFKALQQLSQDLKSGNLQGAQSDFANFQNSFAAALGAANGQAGSTTATPGGAAAAVQAATGSNGTNPASNPLSTDLQSLSQALQSGDIKGAQSAFAKLQTDAQAIQQTELQGLGPHRHHHHGGFALSSQAGAQAAAGGSLGLSVRA